MKNKCDVCVDCAHCEVNYSIVFHPTYSCSKRQQRETDLVDGTETVSKLCRDVRGKSKTCPTFEEAII